MTCCMLISYIIACTVYNINRIFYILEELVYEAQLQEKEVHCDSFVENPRLVDSTCTGAESVQQDIKGKTQWLIL